eukprot:1161943-Pelagomonas_calceolata.AAC.3
MAMPMCVQASRYAATALKHLSLSPGDARKKLQHTSRSQKFTQPFFLRPKCPCAYPCIAACKADKARYTEAALEAKGEQKAKVRKKLTKPPSERRLDGC